MALPALQTALVQTPLGSGIDLPLTINHETPIPKPPTEHHVLVRVLAVALNPNDHKMITHLNMPGGVAGCDFCGLVEPSPDGHTVPRFPPGTRVCGALFAYNPAHRDNGSFAQWLVADSRILVKVPDSWSDLEAASMGVGWSTLCLAFSDHDALALEGLPTLPTHKSGDPVLVYGGGTASGTLACQLLSLMGYTPLAIASERSFPLAKSYGAAATASYTSKDCAATIKSLAGKPIRHVLDCITDMESVPICFSALARTGGRYACLEECPTAWRTRRAVRVKEVMGFQILGVDMDLGESTYTRPRSQRLMDIGIVWAREMERLMESGRIRAHPLREVEGGFGGIVKGLEILRKGEVRGVKLVVRISE
ncbi:chaperonin 10-like protein [Aspergillus falconensis]